MTLNEPGHMARRQMTLTHPLAADWPRWLRTWWGQIQPPALLLRVTAFPTLTRLPSPSLFPALALDVLGRLNSFLSSSLPFLDTGGHAGPASTPRFDYRLRRPRTPSVPNAQMDWGAHPRSELSPIQSEMSAQPHEAATPSGLEPEATAAADVSTVHETAEAESIGHEAASESSLTPFQASEWELPAPAFAHAPTLDEAVHHAEDWREAWSAVDLPALVPQAIGVLRSPIGSTLPSALVPATPVAAHETEAPASQPGLTSELDYMLDAPQGLAGQMLSGLENASSLPLRTDLRMPGSPVHLSRHTPPAPARVHDLSTGEASTLSEGLATENWARPGEIAEQTVQYEAATLSPFSLLGAAPHVSQLLTPERNPILGEVLHRQAYAVEALSLVAHGPAGIPGVHLPAAMTSGESVGALASHQPAELVSNFPIQFAPLHRVANLPNMALRTANIIEERASSLSSALPTEAHGSEVLPISEHADTGHEEQESVQAQHIAQASDPMLQNSAAHVPRSVLDLLHPLDTIASTFRPPSLQVLRSMVPAGAEMGMASLPGLGFGIPPAFMHPARDTQLRPDLASEHVAAESSQAAALTAGEQFASPPDRMNLGSPQGLSLLGREFAHAEHPLALRPLPAIANLLVAGAEHVAQLPEQVLHQVFEPELLPPPRMELRREAHAASALAQGQSHTGGFTGGDWSDQSGGEPVDHRVAATPHSVETPAAETPAGGGDSGATVWQSAGAAPAAGSDTTNLDSLARQVFALLQSQLRAERDRHQIYDR